MSQFYTELCNMFIRPTRQRYNLHDLGNPIVNHNTRRKDFQVKTHHQFTLKCSFFQNIKAKKFHLSNQDSCQSSICVIYLHSFNGSRLQSIRYSHVLLQKGYHFCCFDFAGSGLSDGIYVSLGFHQSKDLLNVMKHLVDNFGISHFFLWGRSMGSSTIIKFCEQFQNTKKQLQSQLEKSNVYRTSAKNIQQKFQSTQRAQKMYENVDNRINERRYVNNISQHGEINYGRQQQGAKSKSNPKNILTTTRKYNTISKNNLSNENSKQLGQISGTTRQYEIVKRELHTINRINILCGVLDSPFCSLNRLAIQIAQNRISMPQIFIQAVFMVIKNTIEKKVEFKVSDLQLLPILKYIKFPIFILASDEDSLIKHKHSQDIYDGLNIRDKQFLFIKGQHHQMRSDDVVDKIVSFFNKCASNASKSNYSSTSLVKRKQTNYAKQTNQKNLNQSRLRVSQINQSQKEQRQRLDRRIYYKSHSRNKLSEQLKTPNFIPYFGQNRQCQRRQEQRVQVVLPVESYQSKGSGFMRHTMNGTCSPSLIKTAFINDANSKSHANIQGSHANIQSSSFVNFNQLSKTTNLTKHKNVCFTNADFSNANIAKKRNDIISQQKIQFEQHKLLQQSRSESPKKKLQEFSKIKQQIFIDSNSPSKISKLKFTPMLGVYCAIDQRHKDLSNEFKLIKNGNQQGQIRLLRNNQTGDSQKKDNRSNQLVQHFSIHKANPVKIQTIGKQRKQFDKHEICKSARIIRGQSEYNNKINAVPSNNAHGDMNQVHMNIISTKIKKRQKELQSQNKIQFQQKLVNYNSLKNQHSNSSKFQNIATGQSQQLPPFQQKSGEMRTTNSRIIQKQNDSDLRKIIEKKFEKPQVNYSHMAQVYYNDQEKATQKKIKKKGIQSEVFKQRYYPNLFLNNQQNQRLLLQRNSKMNIYNANKTTNKKTYRFHTLNHFDSHQQYENDWHHPKTIHKSSNNALSLKNLVSDALIGAEVGNHSKHTPDNQKEKKRDSFVQKRPQDKTNQDRGQQQVFDCQKSTRRQQRKGNKDKNEGKNNGIVPSVASYYQNQKFIVLKSPKKKANNAYQAHNTTK